MRHTGLTITRLRKKWRKERGMTLSSAWTTQEDIYTGNFYFGLWEAVHKTAKRGSQSVTWIRLRLLVDACLVRNWAQRYINSHLVVLFPVVWLRYTIDVSSVFQVTAALLSHVNQCCVTERYAQLQTSYRTVRLYKMGTCAVTDHFLITPLR